MGQTKFSNFFTVKQILSKGDHGQFDQGVNTPLGAMVLGSYRLLSAQCGEPRKGSGDFRTKIVLLPASWCSFILSQRYSGRNRGHCERFTDRHLEINWVNLKLIFHTVHVDARLPSATL